MAEGIELPVTNPGGEILPDLPVDHLPELPVDVPEGGEIQSGLHVVPPVPREGEILPELCDVTSGGEIQSGLSVNVPPVGQSQPGLPVDPPEGGNLTELSNVSGGGENSTEQPPFVPPEGEIQSGLSVNVPPVGQSQPGLPVDPPEGGNPPEQLPFVPTNYVRDIDAAWAVWYALFSNGCCAGWGILFVMRSPRFEHTSTPFRLFIFAIIYFRLHFVREYSSVLHILFVLSSSRTNY
ncbi:uncharacterized protein [Euphorbia lathyris]|uniref:uncharacterized protein n=1 Tax=Euphorbia lathyris TaxID=212925 RepID=UPI003313997A